ncbi:MAG: hypothetical protein HY360_01155 [Verrucomicrobia bacterium]|nr:hypothetical protein [Verrucomicrobiota bacterium]
MISKKIVALKNCRFEVLTRGKEFIGLAKIHIGNTLVRSGRLPLSPYFETFSGLQLARLEHRGTVARKDRIVIKLGAEFARRSVAWMRDHSFDPIHDASDWGDQPIAGRGSLRLVLRPAREDVEGARFEGFSYHWEYETRDRACALFWLMDRASWEIDGDIVGGTVISQSACSRPEITFNRNTTWSTEGVLHFLVEQGGDINPVMTHNLPRFASHGSFDFQFKGNNTLIGVFARVGLIRSLVKREAGSRELKHFDKHIFDEAMRIATVPKRILLNTDRKTFTGQRNLWTWLFDQVHNRARAEFGLREEPIRTCLAHNYWLNFTVRTYYKDLLPAAKALGFESVFIDPVNRNDMTENVFSKNMCCGHEYEPAPRLGGTKAVKNFVRTCRKAGLAVFSWTNNDQSYASPVNLKWARARDWWVKMEDGRLKYGGAYTNVLGIWSFKNPAARAYWVNCLKRIKRETGLCHYLFDSFYNLGFMPVSYAGMAPKTMHRELLGALKELQDAGIGFMIESFGPFGSPQHGCVRDYAEPGLEYAGYKIRPGFGYSTVPTKEKRVAVNAEERMYHFLAHMAVPTLPLFEKGVRADRLWKNGLKSALADYRGNRPFMHKRILQEDGKSVLWHDSKGRRATLWNFEDRVVKLPGRITDATAGRELPAESVYRLKANHTYTIQATRLPVRVAHPPRPQIEHFTVWSKV